jgi:tetratricopeptide (TPR) repeat protein
LVTDPNVGQDQSLDALKADAKALYVGGNLAQAGTLLTKAVKLYPNDSDASMYLGNVLIAAGKPLDAIPVLASLKGRPGARMVFWKLLGYALLFDKNRLKESAEATRNYLNTNPDDLGAKLNLACALAQPGPKDNPDRPEIISLLTEVVKDPHWIERVRKLTSAGEDFELWKDDSKFMTLIK